MSGEKSLKDFDIAGILSELIIKELLEEEREKQSRAVKSFADSLSSREEPRG